MSSQNDQQDEDVTPSRPTFKYVGLSRAVDRESLCMAKFLGGVYHVLHHGACHDSHRHVEALRVPCDHGLEYHG